MALMRPPWEVFETPPPRRSTPPPSGGAVSPGGYNPTEPLVTLPDPVAPPTPTTPPPAPPPAAPPTSTTPRNPYPIGSKEWQDEELRRQREELERTKPPGVHPSFRLPNGSLNHDKIKEFITLNLTPMGGAFPPTPQNLQNIIEALAGVGIVATRPPHAGGIPSDDKILLPDGTMIDLIQDVGGSNARWQWVVMGADGGGGGGGGSPLGPGGVPGLPIGPTPPNQFDDATTKYLEDFLKGRLDELNKPLNDPARDQLAKLLDEQISRYGGLRSEQEGTNAALKQRQQAANVSADEYMAYLKSHAAELQTLPPEVQQAYQQLVSGTNQRITDLSQLPLALQQQLARYRQGTSSRIQDLQDLPPAYQQALDQYLGTTGQRADDLRQLPPELQQALADLVQQTEGRMTSLREPAYTGTEQEILRTQALDPIENDRQAAKQRDLARIGNSGMLPSSGIALALQNETDRAYDRQRNTAQGDIAAKQIAERRARDAEIQRLAEGLFGTKADVSAVGESRKTQAQGLADTMFGARTEATRFGEDRRTQAQDLLTALTETERGAVAFQDERRDKAQDLRGMLMDAARGKTDLETARKTKAGELLGAIPGIQREGVASDLALSNEMQAAIERITQGQIAASGQRVGLNEQVRGDETTRRQEALTLASILQQLPTAAMQQAMAAIGQAPNPESMINQLITLFGIGQTTRNQNAQYYASLGQSLPYLASAFAPKAKPSGVGANLSSN